MSLPSQNMQFLSLQDQSYKKEGHGPHWFLPAAKSDAPSSSTLQILSSRWPWNRKRDAKRMHEELRKRSADTHMSSTSSLPEELGWWGATQTTLRLVRVSEPALMRVSASRWQRCVRAMGSLTSQVPRGSFVVARCIWAMKYRMSLLPRMVKVTARRKQVLKGLHQNWRTADP